MKKEKKNKKISQSNKNFKVIITIIFLIVFQSSLYFIAKFTPFAYHIVNIEFDSYIPLISIFVIPYVLWYLSLFIVPYLFSKYDEHLYRVYVRTIIISLFIAFLIYFFYPTTLIRDEVVVKDILTFIIDLIYKIDTPAINCLPSAHCILSFVHIYITIIIKGMNKKIKVLIIIQSILVILSTLFIKQHVVLDVITAFIISLIVYLLNYIYVKKNLSSAKS